MVSDSRPLGGVDANLLVLFDALVETGSVAETAKILGLSASAVSHALARLREVVGDPVLVRDGRRMVPTARAQEIAPRIREGLTILAAAVADPKFELARVERDLRIAAVDFAAHQILPALFDVLRREAPLVNVLVEPFGPRVFDELATGGVDLVLALGRAQPKLRSKRLVDEAFVSMLAKDHPALRERMTLKRFAALPHVLVSASLRRRGHLDEALEQRGLGRRVVLVVPTFDAAARAVAESDLVLTGSIREATRAAKHLPLALFPPPLELPAFTVSLYWHERSHADPLLAWVRDQLASLSGAGSA